MKAYLLTLRDSYENEAAVVFADTPSKAKAQIHGTELFYDGYTDIRVRRAPAFDGMEKASEAELALKQWREGWGWLDMDYPKQEDATDQEFIKWYNENFGVENAAA